MIAKPTPVLAEIQKAVEIIVGKNRVVEVRAPNTSAGTWSGYYNSDVLSQDVFELSSKEMTPNVYWTIQEIDPNLMIAGRENNLYNNADKTTDDTKVKKYLWLPIDNDPVRDPKLSSTDAEKAQALAVALQVQEFLRTREIESILADSGNGYHNLVPLDIPNQNGAKHLVERVLKALNARFGTNTVQIDTSVFNPSRILKVYGSVARKGEHTSERPWRVSRLIDVPQKLNPLSEERLQILLDDILRQLPASQAAEINEPKTKYEPPVAGTHITHERNNSVRDYTWHIWYNQKTIEPDVEDLKAKVYQFNSEFCVPPLTEDELDRTVLSSTPKKQRSIDKKVTVISSRVNPQISASSTSVITDPEEAKKLIDALEIVDYQDLLRADFRDGKNPWILENVQKPSDVPKQKVRWILDKMLMVNGLHIFSSLPGGQKSILSLMLTKIIASGEPFFGRRNIGNPITVIVMDRENPPALVYERLYGLGLMNLDNVRVWGEWNESFAVPESFDDPRLIECARRMGENVLFVADSLSSYTEGVDENSVQEMNPILRKALRLARACAGVIILHHTDKQGISGRGTVAIRANADMAFLMEKKNDVVTITDEKFRPTSPWTLKYTMDWGGLTGIYTPKLISDSLTPEAAPPSQHSIESVKRREKQATEEATRNHYRLRAEQEIKKAYEAALVGKGDPISNRNQLATLIGLNPTGRTARAILNGGESNPWECIKGERSSIIFLPKGVTEIPPKAEVAQHVSADRLFAEGQSVRAVSEAIGVPFGTVNRWRTEWGKEHEKETEGDLV
jgi:hypothetical protein